MEKVVNIQKAVIDKSKYKSNFTLKNKLGRLSWRILSVFLFKPFSLKAMRRYRVLVLKCFGAKLAWTSLIHSNVKIWAPWNLEMGEYACLGPNVDCYNQGKITIKDHALVSQKSYLCASSHDIADATHVLFTNPIVIEDQAWVAADAFVGPGVHIGQGAVVGVRAAVFKDVQAWTVVGGNPAKYLKDRILKN